MKAKSREVQSTSRRSFTKSIALALSAAPLASTIVSAHSAEGADVQKKRVESFDRTHDTPPPLTFENGSFVMERVGEFQNGDEVINGNRREYRHRPLSGATISPAHIKIVDGTGEVLYRNDHADNCVLSVVVEMTGGALSVVNARRSSDSSRFVIDVDSNKTLDKGNHNNNDKPTSKKRDRRYRHSGAQRIKEITITRSVADPSVLYYVLLSDLPANGDDLKIMVWLESA
jgi:hypothetical protein